LENELNYNSGFLKSVEKKLSNKKFAENAPESVIKKKKKKKSNTKNLTSKSYGQNYSSGCANF
jgi:valyl-tRNA synthetase